MITRFAFGDHSTAQSTKSRCGRNVLFVHADPFQNSSEVTKLPERLFLRAIKLSGSQLLPPRHSYGTICSRGAPRLNQTGRHTKFA